jgi:hypothetical protein
MRLGDFLEKLTFSPPAPQDWRIMLPKSSKLGGLWEHSVADRFFRKNILTSLHGLRYLCFLKDPLKELDSVCLAVGR